MPRQLRGTAGLRRGFAYGTALYIAPQPVDRLRPIVWSGGTLYALTGPGKALRSLTPNTDFETTPGGGD